MAVQIQLRHGTAAAWTAANTVLAAGEAGIETDTNKVKYGDGITTWTSLSYASGGSGGITSFNTRTGPAITLLKADVTGTGLAATDVGADTTGAASAAQAFAIQRANHTGAQAESTVTNLISDLAAKAPLASPSLTGVPTAPTASPGTNTTQVATTAFVAAAGGGGGGSVTGVTASAPLASSGGTAPNITVAVGATAGTVVAGNDSRFAGSPAGTAGASLSATDASTTNTRTPSDGSVTTAKIVGGGIAESAVTNLISDLAAKAMGLTPTAVIAASGTALLAGQYGRYDTTGGVLSIPIPVAPADKTRVGLKIVAPNPVVNFLTFTLGGSDKIDTTTGGTSGTLKLFNQALILQYDSGSAVWTIQSSDLPLSQLDLRYQPAGTSGQITDRGVWTATTAYSVSDSYTNGGFRYYVQTAYTSGGAFNSTDTTNSIILGGLDPAGMAAGLALIFGV